MVCEEFVVEFSLIFLGVCFGAIGGESVECFSLSLSEREGIGEISDFF